MKNLITALLILLSGIAVAQEEEPFNKWSMEVGAGFNKAMAPLTAGYLTPTLNVGHAGIGARYMFNETVGLMTDLGFGAFREARGQSPEFLTTYADINFQFYGNLNKALDLHKLSDRLGLALHSGVGFVANQYRSSPVVDLLPSDFMYNFIFGTTAKYKIHDRMALIFDISMRVNGRQNWTFDGQVYNSLSGNVYPDVPFEHATGTWWTGTAGLAFYLGKEKRHADWDYPVKEYATKEDLQQQFGEIRDMLKDSDGDGIPDYLDQEPNTPAGARVDFKGRTLDSDGDGIPDHLDKCPFVPGPASNDGCPIEEVREIDYFKKAINEGYVNVYFAFDSSKPLAYSTSGIQYISNFMKRNPGVNLEIMGFADEIGPEDYNMKLSERRAKGVYQILIDAGIDKSRLSAKGYGEDSSVDKKSSEARQLARRVSFMVK